MRTRGVAGLRFATNIEVQRLRIDMRGTVSLACNQIWGSPPTWWLIPLSKWVTTLVKMVTLLFISHLLSGINHQSSVRGCRKKPLALPTGRQHQSKNRRWSGPVKATLSSLLPIRWHASSLVAWFPAHWATEIVPLILGAGKGRQRDQRRHSG